MQKETKNINILTRNFNTLSKILHFRLSQILDENSDVSSCKADLDFSPPETASSPYEQFLQHHPLNQTERLVLLLALIPYFYPNFFEAILQEVFPQGGDFSEIGGAKGKNHRGTMPTGETAVFILSVNAFESRRQLLKIFSKDHFFIQEDILYLEQMPPGEPKLSGRILLTEEYADYFLTGSYDRPDFRMNFPGERIHTEMEWSDLVLREKTMQGIEEISTWLKFNKKLLEDWKMKGKIKPGFRVLFYGPPGTGKTLTACLLGKHTNRAVYRIDLSRVVSKYIGETEKNLSKLFDKAMHKDWILFFDEADAIFGKRTGVRDAHDKYANQEVSYLLQRIETHPGLVILASNLKSNIDTAFTRRFNTSINFDVPDAEERLALWENYWPQPAKRADNIDLKAIAKKYQLTGANIVNIIQYISLQTLAKGGTTITKAELLEGIKKEYIKEDKIFPV